MKKLQGAALMAITALTLGAPAQPLLAATEAGPDGPDAQAVERARMLELQARQVSENLQEYGAASKLYRKAAELRGESAEAADAWAMAGTLAYYAGDNRATSDLRKAGEIALAFGRVGFAAKVFMDGAWVAHQRGMSRTALELATRGDRLADSPLLTEADRRALKRRVAIAEGIAADEVVKR